MTEYLDPYELTSEDQFTIDEGTWDELLPAPAVCRIEDPNCEAQ